MKTKEKIYSEAVERFGKIHQLDMCIEECAELIQAINKFKRNPNIYIDLCEEIADAEITIEQLKLILNKDELIDKIKEDKLRRLDEKMREI